MQGKLATMAILALKNNITNPAGISFIPHAINDDLPHTASQPSTGSPLASK